MTIHDTHPATWLSVTQVLSLSSNIGAAKIALGLGEQRLYEGFRRFGFGDTTGIPFPGESMGVLRPRGRSWVQVETAAASFGQGISITTLQLTMAMAAIANGGKLLEPVLVKRITDGSGVVLTENQPRVRRESVNPATAKLVSEMLVAVTEGDGTGVEAAIPGFRVAGKTGTAQKIDMTTGRYMDTHYVASFVGFVPADKPRLVISVGLDEPLVGAYAGGSVAAPCFLRIGEMALRYLGVTPRGTVPMKLKDVAERAKETDVATSTYQVMNEARAAMAPITNSVVTPSAPMKSGETRVPDLAGQPLREAIRAAAAAHLVPTVLGTGRLARVEPVTGTVLPKGSSVKLFFEPSS